MKRIILITAASIAAATSVAFASSGMHEITDHSKCEVGRQCNVCKGTGWINKDNKCMSCKGTGADSAY